MDGPDDGGARWQSEATREKRRQSALAYWADLQRSAAHREAVISANQARRKRPRQKEVPMSWSEVYQVRPRDPKVAMLNRIQRWARRDWR